MPLIKISQLIPSETQIKESRLYSLMEEKRKHERLYLKYKKEHNFVLKERELRIIFAMRRTINRLSNEINQLKQTLLPL